MLDRLLPNVPRPAAMLGLAGLLPFAAGTFGSYLVGEVGGFARFALLGYGALILSFLGGIHWGLAIARERPGWRELAVGVLPSLAGWAGLLLGGGAGLVLLAAGFVGVLFVDLRFARDGVAPPWFARLRSVLTGAVCACLLAAAVPG